MDVVLTNKDNIELFIKDNIELINQKITFFTNEKCKALEISFNSSIIKRSLHEKFVKDITDDPSLKDQLLSDFEDAGYRKESIIEIANKFGIYKSDLEKLYNQQIFDEISQLDIKKLTNSIVKTIVDSAQYSDEKIKYSKSVINKIVSKSIYLSLRNGFSLNLSDMEAGVMTANAGDSAQFLFLARAILAGYNCSNVDVRSSRYDAVIDQNGKLFRVQIKGISDDSSISFKDRNRGGQGIDSKHQRNIGKRITSSDCDLYVAVDKQVGICYIIPISKIEEWNVNSISVSKAQEYKENWSIIDNLANE